MMTHIELYEFIKSFNAKAKTINRKRFNEILNTTSKSKWHKFKKDPFRFVTHNLPKLDHHTLYTEINKVSIPHLLIEPKFRQVISERKPDLLEFGGQSRSD